MHKYTHTQILIQYNGIVYNHKKNEILPLAKIWVDSEGSILSQQLATFSAPGTGFVEDSILTERGWDEVMGIPCKYA